MICIFAGNVSSLVQTILYSSSCPRSAWFFLGLQETHDFNLKILLLPLFFCCRLHTRLTLLLHAPLLSMVVTNTTLYRYCCTSCATCQSLWLPQTLLFPERSLLTNSFCSLFVGTLLLSLPSLLFMTLSLVSPWWSWSWSSWSQSPWLLVERSDRGDGRADEQATETDGRWKRGRRRRRPRWQRSRSDFRARACRSYFCCSLDRSICYLQYTCVDC